MKCENCKKEITVGEGRFCPFCGSRLEHRPEERRNAIIVFGDVSGFTGLSQQLDPDALRGLFDDLMRRLIRAVESQHGIVDKIIGDAIMFHFGTERASADDPHRAIRTIEGIQSELKDFNQERQLALTLHFGAAYGTVSVGRVGTSATVMGETVNLAERLAAKAKPNQVLCSRELAELYDRTYRFELIPEIELKGFRTPVSAYIYHQRVNLAESAGTFVGRNQELRALSARMKELLTEGKGASILVYGPAGIGKSTLLATGRKLAEEQNISVISLYFEEGAGQGLDPYVTLARRILNWDDFKGDSRFDVWREIFAEKAPTERIPADQLELLIIQLMEEVLVRRTLLFQAEDLHRAEPSELVLLENIIRRFTSRPVLFSMSSRLLDSRFGEPILLAPLSPKDSKELFQRLLEESQLKDLDTDKILNKCEGNPLVVAELARALNRGVPADKLFSGNINFILAATIDTFDIKDQELVKQASIFGSRIPLEVLSALAEQEAETIQQRLEPLGLFRFVEKQTVIFSHDLVRTYAYDRINQSVRKKWHGRAADIFVTLASRRAPEIAHHYLAADMKGDALTWSVKAARLLARLPKRDEAMFFLNHAQELALELKQGAHLGEAVALRFEIEARGRSLQEALGILFNLENDPKLNCLEGVSARLRFVRGKFFFERGLYQEAIREVTDGIELGDDELNLDLEILQTQILARLGNHRQVVRLAVEILGRKDLEANRRGDTYSILGYVSYLDKEVAQAFDFYSKSLRAYKKAQDLGGIKKALTNLGNVASFQIDYTRARKYYQGAIEIALRMGDVLGYCEGLFQLATVNARLLEFEKSLAVCTRAIEVLKAGQSGSLLNRFHIFLGFLFRYLGDLSQAERYFGLALKYFEESEDPFWLGKCLVDMADLRREQLDKSLALLNRAEEKLKPFVEELRRAQLLRIDICFEHGRIEEAITQFKKLRNEIGNQGDTLYTIQAPLLRLESILSARKDPIIEDRIREFLSDVFSHAIPFDRLGLLVELLEYRDDPEIRAEARALAHKIEEKFPPRYRENFRKKEYVQRLLRGQ